MLLARTLMCALLYASLEGRSHSIWGYCSVMIKGYRVASLRAIEPAPPSPPPRPQSLVRRSPRINSLACSLAGWDAVPISTSNIKWSGRLHVRFSVNEAIQHTSGVGRLPPHNFHTFKSCTQCYGIMVSRAGPKRVLKGWAGGWADKTVK